MGRGRRRERDGVILTSPLPEHPRTPDTGHWARPRGLAGDGVCPWVLPTGQRRLGRRRNWLRGSNEPGILMRVCPPLNACGGPAGATWSLPWALLDSFAARSPVVWTDGIDTLRDLVPRAWTGERRACACNTHTGTERAGGETDTHKRRGACPQVLRNRKRAPKSSENQRNRTNQIQIQRWRPEMPAGARMPGGQCPTTQVQEPPTPLGTSSCQTHCSPAQVPRRFCPLSQTPHRGRQPRSRTPYRDLQSHGTQRPRTLAWKLPSDKCHIPCS